jgi:hypothetical protein
MNRVVFCLFITLALVAPLSLAFGQRKGKPWIEWSRNEAEKVVNDSPWAHTQTDTDTSQRLYSRTSDPNATTDRTTAAANARLARGAINQEVNVKFRVRFFSARPVRQGLAKLIELDQKPSREVLTKLRDFAETKSSRSIVITASFESSDRAYLGTIMHAFNTATTSTLKNYTYLERTDGKRLFLEQYVVPGKDGFGARFIFPRELDGQPFLNPKSGEVRFHAEYPVGLQIDRRFKVADMIYNGELEY